MPNDQMGSGEPVPGTSDVPREPAAEEPGGSPDFGNDKGGGDGQQEPEGATWSNPVAPRSKILVVDDDPDCRAIVKTGLHFRGYDVLQATNGEEALEMVTSNPPDLIVLDVMMPKMDGLTVCRELRANFKTSTIPIIMLTARAQVEARVQGLETGADDYVSKPFDMLELAARVDQLLRRTRQSLQASPLTGLPGNLALQQKIEAAIQSTDTFAICYIDLDNFKAYNDRYGHFSGDTIIKATASWIMDAVRESGNPEDFVAHIGGDDFMVLSTPDRAEIIGAAIIERFDKNILEHYDDQDRERGFIESFDRRGNKQTFPIMSISIAVVTNELRHIEHHGQLAQIAAELKKYAKTYEGSVCLKDRRRT